MLVKDCEVPINMSLYASVPNWMWEVSDHLKTQEMCEKQCALSTLFGIRLNPGSV